MKVVVVGYDGDAVEAVKHTVDRLKPYFEVLVADIADAKKDWDEMEADKIYETFAYRLLTPIEYKLSKVQEK